jgi:hypothetical protein
MDAAFATPHLNDGNKKYKTMKTFHAFDFSPFCFVVVRGGRNRFTSSKHGG